VCCASCSRPSAAPRARRTLQRARSRRGAAPQQRAHVLCAERLRIVVAAPDDDRAAIREPRRPIEQRDAHRIEQRALARPGRPDDREHAGIAQRRGREIDLELAGEAGEVAAADREDPHGRTSEFGVRTSDRKLTTQLPRLRGGDRRP
jgi:hypothetical protein